MKTKVGTLLFFTLSLPVMAKDSLDLLLKFQKPVSCEVAKDTLIKKDVFIECERAEPKKQRYYRGQYIGNKSHPAILKSLQEESSLAGVTKHKEVKKIQ